MEATTDDSREFTDEQLNITLRQIGEKVRKESFAAGLPVAFLRGKLLIQQYADGREEIIESIEPIQHPARRESL